MKMNSDLKPELLVSDDETQIALCCLRFDGQNVIASNGRAAVMVPVQPDKGDEPATVPAHVWTWARKWSKGLREIVSLICTPTQWQIGVMQGDLFSDETAFIPRDPQKERAANYPDVAKILRDTKVEAHGGIRMILSADLLARVQKALGSNSVRLTFKPTEGAKVEGAILVEPMDGPASQEGVAVIMAMRSTT